MSLNKVLIIGNAAADAVANDKGTRTTFRAIVNESYKDDKGETQERSEGFNVVAFKKLGEIAAQYVKKGQLVYVEGSQRTRSYEKDGEKKYVTEVVADRIRLLGSKPKAETAAPAPAESEEEAPIDFE
ncbi:MAG: single-stranded DNA-binding protein [Sinobacteraceae bacterium]|nr:single-stranded DNA-binding protein [Nevskiaceae bacterium]